MTDQGAEAAEIAVEAGEQPESAEALKAALKSERDARKRFEREFKAAAGKLTEYEMAQKSDLEKLVSERDTLREELSREQARTRAVQTEAAVRDAAEQAGSTNARLVWRLVKDELEVDDLGNVLNLTDAIAGAKAEAPQLFGPGGKSDAGKPAGAPEPGMGMTQLIRRRAGFS